MRCGNRLIEGGESIAVVQAFCGNPTNVQHSFIVSGTTVRAGSSARSTTGAEIPVEIWTYNRGPNKLMVTIRFMDGKVVAIKTLHEYGY